MPTKNQLPRNAKKVFTGTIFDVWQWQQKMFDGSATTFEMLQRPDTVQVIPIVGDKILIGFQQQPQFRKWFPSLPGGRCDAGKNPLSAAKRELLEETGYQSSHWILWRQQRPVHKIIWTIHTYIAHNCIKKQYPHLDVGEKIKLRLITFDQFLKLADNPYFDEKGLSAILVRTRLDPKFRKLFRAKLFKK
jgi:ADP-ribose pyrophosphatase